MNNKAKLAIAAFCAMFAILSLSVLEVQPASATPTVPKTIPNGLPINLIWRGHAYAAIAGSALREAGWDFGNEVQSAGAYYTLMKDDGLFACWYLWVYDGGARDSQWGYWSYATVAHYHWDLWTSRWVLDDLEGPESKVYTELTALELPWTAQTDYYWMDNAGTYEGWNNDGWAIRFTYSEGLSNEGATEWTTNPTFDLRDSADLDWDLLNLEWDWRGGSGDIHTIANDDNHYVTWPGDRHVEMSADDDAPLDQWGEAARVTYGSQNIPDHPYPYTDPTYRLTVSALDKLAVKAVVAMWEKGDVLSALTPPSWTGIKFDAWFADPLENGRLMMIEMYFARSGMNLYWELSEFSDLFPGSNTIYAPPGGNELARTLVSDSIDDYMINLYAFTEANIIGDYQISTFVIDLKAIWNKAKNHFNRSTSDQLYAIALDVESEGITWRTWVAASEIKVTYTDPNPPSNPTGWSSSHTPNVWSTDNTVDISWWGAADSESGVYGYSYLWDNSATTIPDATTVETTATTATSPALTSGTWYFHVRTQDNGGNWASGALHVGPFKIDNTAPSNPNAWTSSHSVGVWSNDNTIEIGWSGASDAHSGVYGYSFAWDHSTTTIPDTQAETTATTTTSWALTSGTWYFHVRTQDNVGNWNTGAFHIGPFYIDPNPPSNPTGWSSSHTPNVWSTDNTVDISWWGAADSESGVYGYSYLWDNSATTVPSTIVGTGTNTVSPTLASGAWYFHVRTRDNAGNWASGALHVGPFRIDTAPPSTPSLLFPYSAVTFTDSQPTFTWNTAADSNSGVQSYTLQLDTTTSFNSGNLRTYTGITATSYEVPTALLRTTWYWRVRAVDNVGNTGTYSSARSIKIDKIKTQLSVSVNPSTIKYQRTTTISGMLIPTTEIIIESTAVGDTYFRYHGMAFDESLPINFWTDKPSSIIGTSSSFFYYVRQANLTAGAHYVTYAVSSYVGHWHVKIYINGVLTGEGDTDVHNHFTVNFYVSGFGSQQVSLSYSNDNGATWSSITTVTTTSTGQYSYVWRPPKKGNYIIKASYSGNSNCYGSSSTTNLTVT